MAGRQSWLSGPGQVCNFQNSSAAGLLSPWHNRQWHCQLLRQAAAKSLWSYHCTAAHKQHNTLKGPNFPESSGQLAGWVCLHHASCIMHHALVILNLNSGFPQNVSVLALLGAGLASVPCYIVAKEIASNCTERHDASQPIFHGSLTYKKCYVYVMTHQTTCHSV